MLELKLHPSRTLIFLLAVAYLLSVVLLWVLPLMPVIRVMASLLVISSGFFYLRRDCLLVASNSILQLRLDLDCNYSYQTRDGTWQDADLSSTSRVTPWLSVLTFSPANSRLKRHVIIFPDSSDTEGLRKLRVLLHWKCGNVSRA